MKTCLLLMQSQMFTGGVGICSFVTQSSIFSDVFVFHACDSSQKSKVGNVMIKERMKYLNFGKRSIIPNNKI